MFAVALKTINSKYFKNIAKNTKDFAQNHQLPLPHALQTISSQNYLKHYTFQSQILDIDPLQSVPIKQKNYPILDLQTEARTHLVESLYPTGFPALNEETLTKIIQKSYKVQINETETLQFQANSPIQDKIVCKKLSTINALSVSVFDGHGGNMLSDFASKKINDFIDAYLSQHIFEQENITPQQTINVIKNSINYAYDRIQSQFFDILENIAKTGNKEIIKTGTCALTCIIYEDKIIVANCGDSQGLIIKKTQQGFSCQSTNQQLNTCNPNQINRIKTQFQNKNDEVFVKSKTNGKVYIKGVLQPTRTLGDYYLKKQKYFHKLKISRQPFKGPYLTHKPDIEVITIEENFQNLIIASDGLWDFVSKKEILKVIDEYSSSVKQNSYEQSPEQNSEFNQEMLSQTYIQKVSINDHQQKKLTEMLRDVVLDKCAKKKGKTMQALMNVKAGQRRTYCDDISIINVSFKKIQS